MAVEMFRKNYEGKLQSMRGANSIKAPDSAQASGQEVAALQQKLKRLGLYPGNITGAYDEATRSALHRYQSEYGVQKPAVKGAMFRPAVPAQAYTPAMPVQAVPPAAPQVSLPRVPAEEYEPPQADNRATVTQHPVLKPGDSGPFVTELQTELKELMYYDNEPSGYYDEATESAVKALQLVNHLTPDGITGADTWSALENLYAPLADCGGGQAPNNTVEYIVQAGDSLYKIARANGTTVEELRALNNLTSDILTIGQVLFVPVQSNSNPGSGGGGTYTVKAGDSLYKLAQKYNTTVEAIMTLNGLTSSSLYVGQVLKMPGGSSVPDTPTGTFTHTVVAGDSLYKLAQTYGTSVDILMAMNNLSSPNLYIGQKLLIPTQSSTPPPSNSTIYTVVGGDSLYKIAQKFGTTVEAIIALNQLTTTSLYIGESLLIPN